MKDVATCKKTLINKESLSLLNIKETNPQYPLLIIKEKLNSIMFKIKNALLKKVLKRLI